MINDLNRAVIKYSTFSSDKSNNWRFEPESLLVFRLNVLVFQYKF